MMDSCLNKLDFGDSIRTEREMEVWILETEWLFDGFYYPERYESNFKFCWELFKWNSIFFPRDTIISSAVTFSDGRFYIVWKMICLSKIKTNRKLLQKNYNNPFILYFVFVKISRQWINSLVHDSLPTKLI